MEVRSTALVEVRNDRGARRSPAEEKSHVVAIISRPLALHSSPLFVAPSRRVQFVVERERRGRLWEPCTRSSRSCSRSTGRTGRSGRRHGAATGSRATIGISTRTAASIRAWPTLIRTCATTRPGSPASRCSRSSGASTWSASAGNGCLAKRTCRTSWRRTQ